MKNGEYNLAKAPEDYPGKTYHKGLIPEHHKVWWEETGELVEKDEVIHHKNEDKKDNRFENLEKMTLTEHNRLHSDGRQIAVLECPECGEIFEREKSQMFLSKPNQKSAFCDDSCRAKYYHHSDITREQAKEYVVEIYKE